jgi:hypothetical protein
VLLYWAAVLCFLVELVRPFARRPVVPRLSFLVLGLIFWLLWLRYAAEVHL